MKGRRMTTAMKIIPTILIVTKKKLSSQRLTEQTETACIGRRWRRRWFWQIVWTLRWCQTRL